MLGNIGSTKNQQKTSYFRLFLRDTVAEKPTLKNNEGFFKGWLRGTTFWI